MNPDSPDLPPPPPPELDQGAQAPPPPPDPNQPSPEEIRAAGEQLGAMLAGGLWMGFKMAQLRDLDDNDKRNLREASIRYAFARQKVVVGASRLLPEADIGGCILGLFLQRLLFEAPPEPPPPEGTVVTGRVVPSP